MALISVENDDPDLICLRSGNLPISAPSFETQASGAGRRTRSFLDLGDHVRLWDPERPFGAQIEGRRRAVRASADLPISIMSSSQGRYETTVSGGLSGPTDRLLKPAARVRW